MFKSFSRWLSKFRIATQCNRSKPKIRLGLEALEAREVPAKFTLSGGNLYEVIGTKETLVDTGVQQFAVDRTGSLYALSLVNHEVWQYAAGSEWRAVTSGGYDYSSIAVDADGNLYALDEVNHDVIEHVLGQGNNWNAVTSGGYDYSSIAVDANGNLYALDEVNRDVIEHVLGQGNNWNVVTSGGYDYSSIAVDANGNLYALDEVNHDVIEHVLGQGNNWNVVTSGGYDYSSIAVDADGNLYALDEVNHDVIEHVLGQGNNWNAVTSGGYNYSNIAVDADGNLYALDLVNHDVIEHVLGQGNNWNAVTSGGYNYSNIAVDATGNLFALETNQHIVYEHAEGQGNNWNAVTSGGNQFGAIAVDATGNLFALETNQHIVYEHAEGQGNNWNAVTSGGNQFGAIAVDATGNLFALETNQHIVYEHAEGQGNNWNAVTSGGNQFGAIAVDATGNLFALETNQHIVYEHAEGQGNNWNAVTSGGNQFGAIAVDATGNLFALETNQHIVYKHNENQGNSWTPFTENVASLQAGLDGSLYALTTSGVFERYTPGGVVENLGYFPGEPTATNDSTGAAIPYSPVTGTLFGPKGPSYLDVSQGAEGDCWLIASLAEVAARDPQDIVNMFTYDGNEVENGSLVGVYTVRFYTQSGAPKYVAVDTELPDGGGYYDRPINGVLWVALAEKAYVEANDEAFVTTSHGGNSYDVLGNDGNTGGWSSWALQAITAHSATDYPQGGLLTINPTMNYLPTAWKDGDLIVLGTSNPASSYIVGTHDYAVVGYNPSSPDPFTLMNPWGNISSGGTSSDGNEVYGWAPSHENSIYGLFATNVKFLEQNFTGMSLGTGAAPEAAGTNFPSLGSTGQAVYFVSLDENQTPFDDAESTDTTNAKTQTEQSPIFWTNTFSKTSLPLLAPTKYSVPGRPILKLYDISQDSPFEENYGFGWSGGIVIG